MNKKDEFMKAVDALPKTNDIVSAYGSIDVKELSETIDRLNKVPNMEDLIKENNRLNNIIKEKSLLLIEFQDMEQRLKEKDNIINELEKVFIECDYQHLQRKLKSLKENNNE